MDEALDIVVTGCEVDQRRVEAGLVHVFGIEPHQARRLLREFPVTAKRGASPAMAERYLAALRSIGARVETRPSTAGRISPAASSLPAPPPSIVARARESQRVQHETERAIKRFRAAEGLDQPEAEAIDLDLFNPAIPKAPPLPHDLARMPNATLPRFSDRPQWMVTNSLEDEAQAVPLHVDAQRPPPISPHAAPPLTASSTPPRRDSGLESVPPRAVGLAHNATASIRPGLSSLRDIPQIPREVRVRLRALWPAFAATIVVAIAFLYWNGVFDSRLRRHERAWRAQGIDAGQAADALAWIEVPSHELRTMGKLVMRELIERLMRAGAQGVYVIQLEPTPTGQRAGGLLVELPENPDARRTLFWHLASVPGQPPATRADHGQAYQTLSLR